jgi:hypothetical protein
MNYSNKIFSFITIVTLFMLVAGLCNCIRRDCGKSYSLKETRDIQFHLKDKITGKDLLTNNGTVTPAPDSVKLKNIKTGFLYQLFTAQGANNTVQLYSKQYNRPAGIIDSLVFFFGNFVPDTLIVHTGIIQGWRGDECPSGKDAGINKVTLRGQVLVETTYDLPVIILQK